MMPLDRAGAGATGDGRPAEPGTPVKIPSYDDLTPGIPDVLDSENVDQLALFLREDLQRPSRAAVVREPAVPRAAAMLYACLRSAGDGPPLATGGGPPAGGEPRALLAVAREFSPRVMRASDSEVLLDVSGLGALIGAPPVIARELTRALHDAGVAGHVAIAPTQTMARLLAAARPGRSSVLDAIDDLPVRLLAPLETLPPALNHRDRARPYETFERWGIATLGDLAALPAAELAARLGRRGMALQRLARGLDSRPFVPDGETPRYIGRLELEWPIEALEPLSFVLARLLEPLAVALERADRGAAAIRLELRLTDRATHARLLQLPAPMRDPRVLRTLLLLDLEAAPPPAAIDIVTLELDPAPARITQFSLLQRALPSPETLSTLTARLSALVGASRIGSPALVDTHEPGAFEMRRYAPDGAAGAADGGADGRLGTPRAAAGTAALVLRRQRQPPAIRVSVEHGRPVHLAAAKRGMPHGAVVEAAGPWRSSGNWWGASWNRDEWDVALATGIVCRIFRDRVTGTWFLEAIYD